MRREVKRLRSMTERQYRCGIFKFSVKVAKHQGMTLMNRFCLQEMDSGIPRVRWTQSPSGELGEVGRSWCFRFGWNVFSAAMRRVFTRRNEFR